MQSSKGVYVSVGVAMMLAGCDGSTTTDPSLPRRGVEIVVDSATYHLQALPFGYQVNVAVTVINDGGYDVYVSQGCGSWGLLRVESNTSWLELGSYGCSGHSRAEPLRVAAGARYTKVFSLEGSFQPHARPPITLDNYIGLVKFRYSFTNPSVTVLRSIESEPFMVLPPA